MAEGREFRVGLLIVSALVVLGVGAFFIGKDDRLFGRKARYSVRFGGVAGLTIGNPVELNGVRVGRVSDVELPEDTGEHQILVTVAIDRRYAKRVRADSTAKIRTLGLLGDKYVEIDSGSPSFPEIPIGGEIPAAPSTSVEQLISSGEDVVVNVVSISHSLASVLERLDKGEGLLGQLTMDSPENTRLKNDIHDSLGALSRLVQQIEISQGPLGRVIRDKEMGDHLASAVSRLDDTVGKLGGGHGLAPALLDDPATKDKALAALDRLAAASQELGALAKDAREGDGLLAKMLHDKAYGQELSNEIKGLVEKLNLIAQKIDAGDGTVARLLNDPQIYDALNDIVVGVNDSKLLRWLIRNRQKAGIDKRYHQEQDRAGSTPPPAEPPPPPPGR
jgi:phospholipid/cholesterol/gamma-HCH transport system substrate-binding protein